MAITLDWLGCATFRLEVDGLVIYLDTFMDRADTAPSVGVSTADVAEADFALIGHSHWDHLAGADIIAKGTGATLICSHESARVLGERGVPSEQMWRAQGGEHFQLSDEVSVRVFPSLHSCIWTRAAAPGTPLFGDYGVFENERQARLAAASAGRGLGGFAVRADWAHSDSTGGALDYLISTPRGTIFFQDSMGYFSGIYAGIRADVAILAAAGRGNIDGEPVQGALEDVVVRECELLRPLQVVLSHHDNFAGVEGAPDLTDLGPVHEALARVLPRVEVLTPALGGSVTLFDR
jgi:L-ascorbate metabolism protein UlaG (beta-lactamase superfamily)